MGKPKEEQVTFLPPKDKDNNNEDCDKSPLRGSEDCPQIVAHLNDESESQPVKKKERVGWGRYVGILLALLASLLFPLAGLIVKFLKDYHPFSLAFWRFQGILLPALPMAFYYRKSISVPTDNSTLFFVLLRGISGCSAIVFQFYSLKFITLADSSVISFSTPVFVALVAHFTLKEKFGIIPFLAGILALLGVVIISRPPLLTGQDSWNMDTLCGTLLSLGCMICATATFILLRHLRTMHYALLNFFFGLWGSLETLGLSLIIWKFQFPEGLVDWGMTIALAAISFVGQLCMTLAFKFEQAATVSLIRSCDVIFVFLWQWAVFQILPDLFSVVGATVVMTGIVMIGFRKWLSQLPPEDGRRQRFSWLLM